MKHKFEILDSLIDQIAIVNTDGEIVFVNNAWKDFAIENSRNAKQTDLGVNYLELCNNVYGEECRDAKVAADGIQKVLTGEMPIFEMEYPCHSLNKQRWFMMRVTPLYSEAGFVVISHINVTNRRLTELEVENQNNKLKTINERLNKSLLRLVHDIQSPLKSIEGLINLTKMEDEEIYSINPYFQMIENSVSSMEKYIQVTLQMLAAGLIIESIPFEILIDDFFESIKHTEVLKTIALDKKVEQSIDFCSDKAEINSILSNLISNSLKYYDPEKEKKFIHISIIVTKNESCITIVDNGIGISEQIIDKIFDFNFQQNKTGQSGSGIGLHLVKKSVELLKGEIKVKSTLGVGTEFTLVLPNLRSIE